MPSQKFKESDLVKRLEGSLFAFKLEDHDPNYEGSGLALLMLTKGGVMGYLGHERYAEELENFGDKITDDIITGLKKDGRRKVYSAVGVNGDFLGWPLYEDDERELDDQGAVNKWREYSPISADDDLYQKITSAGIKVQFVEVKFGRLARLIKT